MFGLTVVELVTASMLLLVIVLAIYILLTRRNYTPARILADKFATVSALKDHLEFQTLLESSTPAQVKQLQAALNSTYGISTVSTETASEAIEAITATNAASVAAAESKLIQIIR